MAEYNGPAAQLRRRPCESFINFEQLNRLNRELERGDKGGDRVGRAVDEKEAVHRRDRAQVYAALSGRGTIAGIASGISNDA